jgi:hypothetical protein
MSSMFHDLMRLHTQPSMDRRLQQEQFSKRTHQGLETRTRTQNQPIADMGSALKQVRKSKVELNKSYVSATTCSPYK